MPTRLTIVAARAKRARILWLRGYPDDARQEAEQCISEALRLGHAQSTCWALAFNVCPIAIWRGDLAEARHFVQLLREYSQNVFQHYHEWGMLYDQLLNEGTSQLDRHNECWFVDPKPNIPAQSDLLATFDAGLVTPDTTRLGVDPFHDGPSDTRLADPGLARDGDMMRISPRH
jgi:hypothetical protein